MSVFAAIHGSAAGFVDWITCVFDEAIIKKDYPGSWQNLSVRDLLASYIDVAVYKPTKPRFGYSAAWHIGNSGAIAMINFLRPEMGLCAIWDGQAMQRTDWRKLLIRLKNRGARFTRVDCTVDFLDNTNIAEQLFGACRAGEAQTKVRKYRIVKSNTGDTFYAGSRDSGLCLRVYDKGGEEGGKQLERWRAELECKGHRANEAANSMVSMGTDAARRLISGFFKADSVLGYTNALKTAKDAITLDNKKRRTDTEAWLVDTIAPTLAKVIGKRPEFIDEFMSAVAASLT